MVEDWAKKKIKKRRNAQTHLSFHLYLCFQASRYRKNVKVYRPSCLIYLGSEKREWGSYIVGRNKIWYIAFREYFKKMFFSLVQLLSSVRLFVTPWTAGCQASLSITNSWSLPRLMFIDSVMPSNHLILCRPLLLSSIFPSVRVFSNESALHIRWPKYWSLNFKITSFKMLFKFKRISWIYIGRIDAEAPILWLPNVKSQLIGKDLDAGKGLKAEGEGDDRG